MAGKEAQGTKIVRDRQREGKVKTSMLAAHTSSTPDELLDLPAEEFQSLVITVHGLDNQLNPLNVEVVL